MATHYTPTEDELRAAYRHTRAWQVMGWPYEKGMGVPTIAIAVDKIACSLRADPANPYWQTPAVFRCDSNPPATPLQTSLF